MLTIGIDEAGRGPWAGPLFAAVVILNPEQEKILVENGIKDSKKLTERKREKLFNLIINNSVFYKIKFYSSRKIDKDGIYKSTQKLIKQLATEIPENFLKSSKILVDGRFPGLKILNSRKEEIPHECIIRGDAKINAIAAASILAKVQRDKFMLKLDKIYPEYQFAKHKGYGTKLHMEMLSKFGPCREHRKSFKPIKDLIKSHQFAIFL